MPEEETVTFDGVTIPLRVWESEVMLRCAAWVAIVQTVAVVYHCVFTTSRLQGDPWNWWPIAAITVLTLFGLLAVRSWGARGVLLLAGVGYLALWLSAVSRVWFPSREETLYPLAAAIAAFIFAIRLLRRSPLARDALMVLCAGWICQVFPAKLLRPDYLLTLADDYRGLERVLGLLPFSLIVAPALFGFAVLLGRPGRALHAPPRETRPLARIRTIWMLRPSARAWASLGMLLLAVLGVAVASGVFQLAVGGGGYYPWY